MLFRSRSCNFYQLSLKRFLRNSTLLSLFYFVYILGLTGLNQAYAYDFSGRNLGNNGDGQGISFALNNSNQPSFSYFNSEKKQLRFTEFSGGSWATTIVDSSIGSVPSVSLSGGVTSVSKTALVYLNSAPHIVYYHSNSKQLRIAYRSGNTWKINTIDSSSNSGGSPSAVVCGSQICVSYYDPVSKNLRFARGTLNAWAKATPHITSDEVGALSDIALNTFGDPVIAYTNASKKIPMMAFQLSNGSWQVEEVKALDYKYGLYPSVAVGADGVVHISSSHYTASSTPRDLAVYYSKRLTHGTWETARISDDWAGGATDIGLGSNNLPRIVHRYLRKDSGNGHSSAVTYAELQKSGHWLKAELSGRFGSAGGIYSIGNIQLASSSNATPLVAYDFSRGIVQGEQPLQAFRIHGPESAAWHEGADNIDLLDGGGDSGSGGSNAPDSDGDGISNDDERKIGTDPAASDSDLDGVTDGKEVEDGSNPLDPGSFNEILGKTVCSEWNGFLGNIWNIFEHVNLSNRTLSVKTSIYDILGNEVGTQWFTIAPGAQQDILIHDMQGRAAFSYGRVCSTHNGSAGDMNGRMVYYKPGILQSTGGFGFQFAFALPVANGIQGEQFVPFNTYHPSLASWHWDHWVTNWIQISNLSAKDGGGVLRYYDISGTLIGQQRIGLKAGARADYPGHQFGPEKVGLIRWTPDRDDLKFMLRNVRYLYDNASGWESFDTAFQVEGRKGSGELLAVPLDTNSMSAILEVSNATAESVAVQVEILDSNGVQKFSHTLKLAAYASSHLITDGILGAGQRGLALIKGSKKQSVVAVAMHYNRRPDHGINYMFGVPAKEALGTVLRGSYNTYLGQDSNLWLLNPTDNSQVVTITMTRSDGNAVQDSSGLPRVHSLSLPPKTSAVIRLNDFEGVNQYGVVTAQSTNPSAIVAWVMRERLGVQHSDSSKRIKNQWEQSP